jgi:hypothetical protein
VRDEDELHRCDISRTMSQKRPTLFSSSGASTSSSRQNGAGFRSKIENTSATAVSAFSPPESCVDRAVALAGRARHDRDASLEHVLADELEIGVAAAEEPRELLLQAGVDAVEGVLEARAGLRSILRIASRACRARR